MVYPLLWLQLFVYMLNLFRSIRTTVSQYRDFPLHFFVICRVYWMVYPLLWLQLFV